MISTAAMYRTLMPAMLVCMAMVFSCTMKPSVTIADADNGTRVEIKSGEILAVRLSAQLGTGFGWKVVAAGKNLEQKGEPQQAAKEGQRPGASDYQVFTFKAVEKGESELKLQYIEGWKKDAKPLRDFAVTVMVK
ncbi:MAG TPA: protease inhibitor I42 family protein [Spirochaetota bacterium]|nr:protease inhibitor I42 family protein [Spirochaetota bacterium]HPC41178.1 protease inhibitor I42 family protein [Spirochaetota bacterium]HPL17119.1 protease inhibitor I42 family protein [Spirochaetota bacterium]HQF07098.1 protease inhibitor I42 family protein [Spirochaetota bacterium]HQH95835.1 protease inhibitor I42 family protein [Spirochaetota bacterium]